VIEAIVLIEAEPGHIADLADDLLEIAGVAEVYSVTGDADIVAVVRVREHEHLADVVTHGIAVAEGVRRTRTLVAFRSYRNADFAWDTGTGAG
jgi:DNA-binding Lrp family transcriptional regulator